MRIIFTLLLALCSATALAARHEMALSASMSSQLDRLPLDTQLVISGFPDGHGGTHTVQFKRIDVYAPGARLIVIDANGEREIPRSQRIELIGTDEDGQMRVHLGFDPGLRNLVGSGSAPAGNFAIHAQADSHGSRLVVQPSEEALPAGVTPQILGTDDAIPNPQARPLPPLTLGLDAVTAASRSAVVAVDVDQELLVKRFGGAGNTAAAASWIADLFASMNVMYERDLNITLLQGTTIFRSGGTPYTISTSNADGTDLDNFGNYWQAHHAGVSRVFAMLLSGRMTSGNSASGIAWVNAYCSSTYSYSVNKVFWNSGIGVDSSARIVGHELGHNFGADHTHCTSASNGTYPTASNTIDKCFNAESGCYAGTPSCPTSGPGFPKGSVMSYCHVGTSSGGANCGSNVLQFHPVQVTTLSALIAQNTPACIAPSVDQIFKNGFD
ncbi:M12 family metallo-peptidase [Dokdonella sp.]|uniref:M12 family metallo-peptidase n=1 Tax=Dokdonella sp. TaxID=2291710 RepID=UPI0025BF2008|nr:M12 family metallo-peptidase [Dokdonella sp.]MBX3688861.1 hypothetical protein [Dokdonella sp.]